MAITNAQQFKQLVNPPMEGKKRPGYRGDAAARSTGAAQSGRADPGSRGDPGEGRDSQGRSAPTRGEPAFTSPDRFVNVSSQAIERAKKFKASQDAQRDSGNFFTNLLNPRAKRRAMFNASLFLPGSKANITKKREAYAEYLKSMGITPSDELLDTENLYDFFDSQAFEKNVKPADANVQPPMNYGDFILERFGSPGVKFSGNVGNIEVFKKPDGTFGYREKRDNDGQQVLPIIPKTISNMTDDAADADAEEKENTGRMFRLLADGGMTEDAPVGGIMDIETGRQMYGLGKLVKKATRAVKKIVKSPIGKAALAFGAYKFGPQILSGEGFGLGSIKKFKDLKFFGDAANVNMGRLIGLTSLAPFVFGKQEEDDEEDIDRGPPLEIDRIRANPYLFTPRRFAAEGGSMKEPVAKKTMPLIDMNGKEKDYRETGGFVDMGRMERADDVPARLSKNEFVFTADAVRNAGDGSVDKGAEVMYNMMKNLEAGGDVSEESQGLDGAREMFQTSQRLGEVL